MSLKSIWLTIEPHTSLDNVTKILSSVASIATAAALIFVAWQVLEARRQTQLSAYQAQSDNIAKTGELVKYIQSVQSQTLKLQQWRSLADGCVWLPPQPQNCSAVGAKLNSFCGDRRGQNPLCSVTGVTDWVSNLADLTVGKQPLSSGDKFLRDAVSQFLDADVIGITDKTSLAGEMGAALDGCAYFVGETAAANLSAWREIQVNIKIAGNLDQLRIAAEQFLNKSGGQDRSSEALSELGAARKGIIASFDKLRQMKVDQPSARNMGSSQPTDIDALAWAIQLVSAKLESEIAACKVRADNAVAGAVKLENIRRSLDTR